MKRWFPLLLVLMMLAGSCVAEQSVDLTGMTTEQLLGLRTSIDGEILTRQDAGPDGYLVYEDENIRVFNRGIKPESKAYAKAVLVVENNSEDTLRIRLGNPYLNRYQLHDWYNNEADNLLPHSRAIIDVSLELSKADIEDHPEMAERFDFKLMLVKLPEETILYTTDYITCLYKQETEE